MKLWYICNRELYSEQQFGLVRAETKQEAAILLSQDWDTSISDSDIQEVNSEGESQVIFFQVA